MIKLKTFGELRNFFISFAGVQVFISFLFTAFVLLFKLTLALYESGDDVVQLTSTSFDRLVTQSDNVWIIEFYAPWCKLSMTFSISNSKSGIILM